jgi:ATP-dependent DNA helicase RecQ
MSTQLTITREGVASKPLCISIPGVQVEVSALAHDHKLIVEEVDGGVTIRLFPIDTALSEAIPTEVTPLPPEVIPEATTEADSEDTLQSVNEAAVPISATKIQATASSDSTADSTALFQQLVRLRKQISTEEKLPPYIIFHDGTLREMCRVLPGDLEAMRDISGIGAVKLEKYGNRLIEVIRAYVNSQP